jgi:hypothetical protein
MEICSMNVAVYSLFGDGEGRGYTVCMSVHIRQSNQWNSAARMLQNFHHTLYISDYNVLPMEICGMIVTVYTPFIYAKCLVKQITIAVHIWEHEIADVTKKARIYTILSEIFTLCLCF